MEAIRIYMYMLFKVRSLDEITKGTSCSYIREEI